MSTGQGCCVCVGQIPADCVLAEIHSGSEFCCTKLFTEFQRASFPSEEPNTENSKFHRVETKGTEAGGGAIGLSAEMTSLHTAQAKHTKNKCLTPRTVRSPL